ncbi:MAG: HEAT repeat domain-containing protein [Planctomycetaceae bacterium]
MIAHRITGHSLAFATFAWITISGIANGVEPVTLRYKWEEGATHHYRVTIVIDRGDEVETKSGTPLLQVKKAGQDGSVVQFQQTSLGTSVKLKQQRQIGLRPPFRPPAIPAPPFPGSFVGHELTLDDRGRVISARGESQLPMLLGNLSQLLIEPMPAEAVTTWTDKQNTSISIQSNTFPFSIRGREVEQERINAEESTTFTVEEVTPARIVLKREHTLQTIETVGGEPRIALTGTGTLTMDRQLGLPAKLDYTCKLVVREENVARTYPITVNYELMTLEQVAELKAKQAEMAAEREAVVAKQAAENAEPLTDEERRAIIADLQSGDRLKTRQALDKLAAKTTSDPDGVLSAVLVGLMQGGDIFTKTGTIKALANYGTEDAVPVLLEGLDDSNFFVQTESVKALGRMRAEQAVDPLVALLAEPRHRLAASEALKSMGAIAEEAVHDTFNSSDWTVRMEGCKVLQEIGTSESLDSLRELARSDSNLSVKRYAEKAIEAIEKRQ